MSYCSWPSATSTWSPTLNVGGTLLPSSMEDHLAPLWLASTVGPPPQEPSSQDPTRSLWSSWLTTACPEEGSWPPGLLIPQVGVLKLQTDHIKVCGLLAGKCQFTFSALLRCSVSHWTASFFGWCADMTDHYSGTAYFFFFFNMAAASLEHSPAQPT